MAERMIIEPVERIEENYLEARNKVIENCWHMIVGNDTPKQEDGWLEVMNDRQTKNGIANIYNFIYKGEKALTLEEVQGYGANRYFISSGEYTLADYMRAVQKVQNTEDKAMTIKLQGIYNQQAAKAVKELKTGDVIVWNYGYTSTVVDLIPSKTGKTITCMLKSNQDGVIRERKMGAERLVAIA